MAATSSRVTGDEHYNVFQITTVLGPVLNTETHFKTRCTTILQLLCTKGSLPPQRPATNTPPFLLIVLGSLLSREVYDLPFDRALYKLLLCVNHRKE